VTLLSDFGAEGPYVAAMKGMILRICPQATIVDLTHEIPAHDVWSAAFLLDQASLEFPPESVHVAVVDPGVGSSRLGLAGRFGDRYYVFPDNGLVSFVQKRHPCQGLAVLRNQQYMRNEGISMTFHGRDVFSPAGAHLAAGVSLDRLGPTPDRYKLLEIPTPAEDGGVLRGQVVYIDRFGNCVSNLTVAMLDAVFENLDTVEVWCKAQRVGRLAGTYSFVEPGHSLALINSMGLLEVAFNQGNAAGHLGVQVGDPVSVAPESQRG
jgi:hypothetical protein